MAAKGGAARGPRKPQLTASSLFPPPLAPPSAHMPAASGLFGGAGTDGEHHFPLPWDDPYFNFRPATPFRPGTPFWAHELVEST